MEDPGPVHIPSIQERAECLISKFKGRPKKPPKVNLNALHGCAVAFEKKYK